MSARLSLIALVLVGCRDDAAKPATRSSTPTVSTGEPRPTLEAVPAGPAATPEQRAALAGPLEAAERAFRTEPVDEAWATKTHASIKTRAQWAEVECRSTQCRVAFIAATGDEAMAKSDQLRALTHEDSDAVLAHWMPMPPIPRADGSLEVRLYATVIRK